MAPLSILPLLQRLTPTYPSSLDKCDSCWEFSGIVDDDGDHDDDYGDDDDGDHDDHGGDDDDGDEVEEKNED